MAFSHSSCGGDAVRKRNKYKKQIRHYMEKKFIVTIGREFGTGRAERSRP